MVWLKRDPGQVGLEPSDYTASLPVPTFDPTTGLFEPGDGGVVGGVPELSDVDPQAVADTPDPGTATESSRADHVHDLGPLDSLTLRSPDGTLWDVTVDNAGTLSASELDVRITDLGTRTTDSGRRTVENI